MLSRPGKLSADYCNGIRRKYFKPISLFLILIVIYLLFPFFEGLNMRFNTYVSPQWQYSSIALPVAKAKMKSHAITEAQLAEKYDKKSPAFAKLFILILIPLSSFVLAILFFTSRRYLFDHFILATEIISFVIFTVFLALPLLVYIIMLISPSLQFIFRDGAAFSYIVYIALSIYVSIAFRNFYKQKKWLSLVKGVGFWFVYLFGIQYVYRILLYLLIMLFI